jgi:hypothetical protein
MADRLAQLYAVADQPLRITDRELNVLLESVLALIHNLDRLHRLAPQEETADPQTLWYLSASIKILLDRINSFKQNHNLQRFEWLRQDRYQTHSPFVSTHPVQNM